MKEAFFYGLFMDEQILAQRGVACEDVRLCYLDNFGLKLARRLNLVVEPGARVYGCVMRVDCDALIQLYASESLAEYVSREVYVITDGGKDVEASCYMLAETDSQAEAESGAEPEYVAELLSVIEGKKFPASYVARVRRLLTD